MIIQARGFSTEAGTFEAPMWGMQLAGVLRLLAFRMKPDRQQDAILWTSEVGRSGLDCDYGPDHDRTTVGFAATGKSGTLGPSASELSGTCRQKQCWLLRRQCPAWLRPPRQQDEVHQPSSWGLERALFRRVLLGPGSATCRVLMCRQLSLVSGVAFVLHWHSTERLLDFAFQVG